MTVISGKEPILSLAPYTQSSGHIKNLNQHSMALGYTHCWFKPRLMHCVHCCLGKVKRSDEWVLHRKCHIQKLVKMCSLSHSVSDFSTYTTDKENSILAKAVAVYMHYMKCYTMYSVMLLVIFLLTIVLIQNWHWSSLIPHCTIYFSKLIKFCPWDSAFYTFHTS